MDEEIVSVHREDTIPTKTESAREDWRPYHGDLIAKLLLEKVRDATARQSMVKLKEAIDACEQHALEEHKEVVLGKRRLEIITAKHSLKEAVKSAQKTHIKSEILKITENPTLKKELQQDVIEAEQFITELARRNRAPEKILVLNRKTLTEIRRCFYPQVTVKRTIQASLLLMGEDEDTTKEWVSCLRFLNPQGRGGLIKRILDFDRETVHPEISARSKQILTTPYDGYKKEEVTEEKISKMTEDYKKKYLFIMDLTSVRQASPAAAAFYVWSMGVIDECESRYEDEPTPATNKRQKYLLRKPSLEPPMYQSKASPIRKWKFDNEVYLQRK